MCTKLSGSIGFTGAGATKTVTVPVFNPATPARDKVAGFVESNGYVSMEAEHFSRTTDRQSAGWRVVGGLGRTGDAVMVLPTTLASITATATIQSTSPLMEYDFYAFSTGNATVQVYCLPNQSVGKDAAIRYAVAVDNGTPTLVDVSGGWSTNVLRATAIGSSTVTISALLNRMQISRMYSRNTKAL
jgi:hypothetical protein